MLVSQRCRCVLGRPIRPLILLGISAGVTHAQSPASGTVPPPHPLGGVIATSPITFGTIRDIRPLSDGRVLVNDQASRTVTVLDANLAKPVVVLDSASGHSTSYGMLGHLVPFFRDSTLFFDYTSKAFLVLDPMGKVARTMAGWPTAPFVDPFQTPATMALAMAGTMTASGGIQTTFSPSLGLMTVPYAGISSRRFAAITPDTNTLYRVDDSLRIIGMNPTTRTIDTVATFVEGVLRISQRYANSNIRTEVFQPYDPQVVTADGSLAIVRAREYRIDWINPDHSKTAGPRLPYPWQRLSDIDKARVLDSSNTARAKADADKLAAFMLDSTNFVQGKPRLNPAAPAPRFRPAAQRPSELADVADFEPAIDGSHVSVLADWENNVWIMTRAANRSPDAPAVYDVVNRQNQIVDRVRLAVGQTLIGFGPNATAYLVTHDAGRMTLIKAHVR